jgi:Rrf2 family transcriptional regulator, nitric oxide-sensitive transcriptional repressor
MENILKISEAASLAMHSVVYLASNSDAVASTNQIAEVFEVSEHHLSKVLQRLTKAGLVKSVRGPKGGFILAKDPEEINLLDIYTVIEGGIPNSLCLLKSNTCMGKTCILGDLLSKVNTEVARYLTNTKVSDLLNIFELNNQNENSECMSSSCSDCG